MDVMKEEIRILKERAIAAHRRALEAFNKGDYDWAVFLLEQSLQLLVKYFLALKIGYFPRTYSLSRLLEESGELDQSFSLFLEKNRVAISFLEDAYISSRYLPRRYSRAEVEDKFVLFEELLGIVKRHESS